MNYAIGQCISGFSDGFQNAAPYFTQNQCAFLTAFRKDDLLSPDGLQEQIRRSKQLESAVRASGLSYISEKGKLFEQDDDNHITCVPESTFCIINNRFTPEDFVKLMVHWCGAFDLDDVFVTEPMPERNPVDGKPLVNKPIDVVGTYYDTYGTSVKAFHHADLDDADVYFSNIYGTDFIVEKTECHETEGHPLYTADGHALAVQDFQDLYPKL